MAAYLDDDMASDLLKITNGRGNASAAILNVYCSGHSQRKTAGEKFLRGADCMRAWLDRGAVTATMLVIVSGSLYGVVRFSIAAGGLNWFQQAWDEHFADILDSSFRLDSRSASQLLGQLLLALVVRDPAWIILAYDLVFPTAVAGMAYLVSKHFATHVVGRLAWAIALVFSIELLTAHLRSSEVIGREKDLI